MDLLLRQKRPVAPWGLLLGAFLPEPALAEDRRAPPTVSGSYVVDVFANLDGGAKQGAAVLGKAEVAVEFAGAPLGIEGAQARAAVQYTHGRMLSGDVVGDAQTVSNVEAVSALRAYEAWLSVPVRGGTTVKAGLIDLNTDFDVQEVGLHFVNSSHGIGPDFSQSGLNGPSIFPTTATGIVVSHASSDNLVLRLGLFDGVAGDPERPRRTVIRFPGTSGALVTAEIGLAIGRTTKLRMGGWRYTRRFEEIEPAVAGRSPSRGVSAGGYATIEGKLAGRESKSPLHGWLRWGLAAADVNPIANYLGGGLTYGGEDRKWGIAFAHARLGRRARESDAGGPRLDRAETNIELSYAHALGERVTIQPDVQYVINPGWAPGRPNALLAGVRIGARLF